MALNTNHKKSSLDSEASIYQPNREQSEKAKWNNMSKSERITHFKEYYLTPIFIGLIIIAISSYLIIDAFKSQRDVVFMAAIVNDIMDENSLDQFSTDFLNSLNLDNKKADVNLDDHYLLTGGTSSDALSAAESIMTYVYAKQLDVMIADSDSFDHYASLGCFYDYSYILSNDDFEKYKDYLYYPTIEETEKSAAPSSDTSNKPTETYPCGISLAQSSKYKSLQGAQDNPIIGVVVT